jgi:D-amino-acid oxidase
MKCTIIGGGIQAVSTGILLEYVGHDTTLLSDVFAYLDGANMRSVASNYAAASVYPVDIESEYSDDELIHYAESTFEPFYKTAGVPVRKQTRFHLSEKSYDDVIPTRMAARDISRYNHYLPSRGGESVRDGYVCKEYFVEMPEYMPLLFQTYTRLGGTLKRRRVASDEISALAGTVFNCSGYGSRTLFEDDSMRAIKGHLLMIPSDDVSPFPFSYNYTSADHDSSVYMYSRRDAVLFGGSHLMGAITDGEWTGDSPISPMCIDDETFPARVYNVNADIMSSHITVNKKSLTATHGYRPYREAGLRLQMDTNGVIHNYGHGGAGVSLSWWSALQAVGHIDTINTSVLSSVATAIGKTAQHQQTSINQL